LGRSKKYGRKLNGVLVVNKAKGASSNHVLQRAKRLFFANKAGHTGALDPLATGVLPVCFGDSTKFSQYLLDADKRYISEFCLGVTTDTADVDGKVLVETDASAITESDVLQAMDSYRGDIEQVPPMYSALKKDGQPLYKLARAGIEVERKARPVTLYEYELLEFEAGARARAKVRVHCSKGTYIRSLAADLGEDLGVGGHVTTLHRTQTGAFSEDDAFHLDDLEKERGEEDAEVLDHHLLAVDAPIADMAKIDLDMNAGHYFSHGNPVMDLQVYKLGNEGDSLRVFDEDGKFLGVGEITDDGRVAPRRLIAS